MHVGEKFYAHKNIRNLKTLCVKTYAVVYGTLLEDSMRH